MQHKSFLPLALASTLVLAACSKMGGLSADNFNVTPSPLEAVAGQVPATINGRFPEKYMKKKAVVTVVPVLRYAGGQTTGQPTTFQGEKVQGNNQEISYKVGGNYTMRNTFDYIPEMEQSELYLTFAARVGNKPVNIPEVKVADGVLATSALLSRTVGSAGTAIGEDAYQYTIAQSQQAQIKYLINQAKVRTSELKSVSVQDFIQTLRNIKADQKGFEIDGIEISAYASPDGALSLNTKLAEERQKTSAGYVKGELRKMNIAADIEERYTAEDWDGFQQLVAGSNLQDKDVILRVLSMYEDPEIREQQIRSLSAAYTELADEILPELRRARLTLNYNIIGRSDDEIEDQFKNDASQLSVEEILYLASLTENAGEKEKIYDKATQLYPSDFRAYNNLAGLAYAKGNLTAAKNYLAQAASKKSNAAEVNANSALIALAEGHTGEAENLLAQATSARNYGEVLGNLQIAKGNYAQAAQMLAGTKTNSAALAQILNKDYSAAAQTLAGISAPDATTSYLEAIVAARTNQTGTVLSALQKAFDKDASLKARAAKDLEFAALFSNSAFRSLVN